MWTTLAKAPLTVKAIGEALVASGLGAEEPPLTGAEIVSCCEGFICLESIKSPSQHPERTRRWRGFDGPEDESQLTIDQSPDDPVVTFTHLSALRHCESKRETYFPGANDAMMSALLSVADAEAAADALVSYYTWMMMYHLAISSAFQRILTDHCQGAFGSWSQRGITTDHVLGLANDRSVTACVEHVPSLADDRAEV